MLEYLEVERFLRTLADTRALRYAFDIGLIDRLRRSPAACDDLPAHLEIDERGLRLLLDLLRSNHILEETSQHVSLSEPFQRALRFQSLLEAKIDFANLVAPDFLDHFDSLLNDQAKFMGQAKLFELFDYGRCFDDTEASLAATRDWVRFTTALTRHEALVGLSIHDLANYRRMLDIGGNSGEFVVQACRRNPHLEATVVDLPLVCDVGAEHVASEPEAERISFFKANALADSLPAGFDLVSFKSVLHDWPDEQMGALLQRAEQCLAPGGVLQIFERGPVDVATTSAPYGLLPVLLFYRFYRSPDVYRQLLETRGFQEIECRQFSLETPFFLLTARKC